MLGASFTRYYPGNIRLLFMLHYSMLASCTLEADGARN